jgi:DNA-binding IclR family transcriptional regulator
MESISGIQVISRAAAILRVCKSNNDGMSLGSIAEVLDLPRSTVQRIVGALVAEGLLQTGGVAKSIRLGPEIHALSDAHRVNIVEVAHPFLKVLSEQTGETVDLALYKCDHMIFIDQVVGSHRLRAISSVGEQFPVHNTANGKASLALLDEPATNQILKALQARAKFNSRALKTELQLTRKTGFAIDNEEHSHGICAIGAAFKDATGGIYAISIPMPSIRFKANRTQFTKMMLSTRDGLMQACGG